MANSQKYGIEVVTPPVEEPATLAELKSHLRLGQNEDDEELAGIWIPAARELIEREYDLRLITQTLKVYFDDFNSDREYFELPVGPAQSVTTIQYYNETGTLTTFSSSNYAVDTKRSLARVVLNSGSSWPTTDGRANGVIVTFVAGFGAAAALPKTLKAAVMLQARSMFDGESELAEVVSRLVGLHWSGAIDAET